MVFIGKVLFIFVYVFLVIMLLDFSTGNYILNKIDKIITKCRKKKHPLLFSYIRYYNNLAESHNEIYKKEFLPLLKCINCFYNNIQYFSQGNLKRRTIEIERQKQLLENSQEDMEKVLNNAQEYYKLIEEYTKAHKISWADKYLIEFLYF